MSSEFSCEASDEASENELLDRSLSVWRGWSAIEKEDFTPVPLDLHTACSIGQYDWVRSIISRNDSAFLDRKNKGGWTSLMYACYIGHDNIVNLLVKAGCQMNKMKNPRGHTPLMLAASCGNESVARTLVRNGAELEVMDKSGWTALFHATYAGHQNFVAYLLEAGANINAVEPTTGLSPFMLAAAEGHEIIVQLFLQHGVNVHAKAYNGDMARSLALIKGYMKIVSLIDNHILPINRLRSEPGLDFYLSSSDDDQPRPLRGFGQKKSKGPSIQDGPEAIARMIDRSRPDDMLLCTDASTPKGYMSFCNAGEKEGTTQLSYRDVTSPINPEDYKDTSGGTDLEDLGEDSNAFSKTGAITIKSSSSSSGGLVAALGLSREGSLDSDDSRCNDLLNHNKGENLDEEEKQEKREKMANDGDRCGAGEEQKEEKDKTFGKTQLPIFNSQQDNEVMMSGSAKEKPRAVVTPLRDYFPLDVSFPPVAEHEVIPQSRSRPDTQGAEAVCQTEGNVYRRPPTESMSQSEIVSAYFESMTPGSEQVSSKPDRQDPGSEKKDERVAQQGVPGSQIESRVSNINQGIFQQNANVCHGHNVSKQMANEDRFLPVRQDRIREESVDEVRVRSNPNPTQQTRSNFQSRSGHTDKFSNNPSNFLDDFNSLYAFPHGSIPPDAWGGLDRRNIRLSQHDFAGIPFIMKEGNNFHQGGQYQVTSTHISPASYPHSLSSQPHHYQQNCQKPPFIRLPHSSLFYPQHQSKDNLLTSPQQQQQSHQPFTNQHVPPPPLPIHLPRHPAPRSYVSISKGNFQNFPQGFYSPSPGHPRFDPSHYYKGIPSDIYYSDMNTISGFHLGSDADGQNQNCYSETLGSHHDHIKKMEQDTKNSPNNFVSSSPNSTFPIQELTAGYEATSMAGPQLNRQQTLSDDVLQMSLQLQENLKDGQSNKANANFPAIIHSPNTISKNDGRCSLQNPRPLLSRSLTTPESSAFSSVINQVSVPSTFSPILLSQLHGHPQIVTEVTLTTSDRSSQEVHRMSSNLETKPSSSSEVHGILSSSLSSYNHQINSKIYSPFSSHSNNLTTENQSLDTKPSSSLKITPTPALSKTVSNLNYNNLSLQVQNHSTYTNTQPSRAQELNASGTKLSFNSTASVPDLSQPVPNSVMIPGHTTSQPVSQAISWLGRDCPDGSLPRDLQDMLTQLGLSKYSDKFEEQDVDLQVFLSLTDHDLKEVGIKLFGPRKKMANAIARWHSQAPLPSNSLEQAYADRLEGEMQELAIQLNQACANEEKLKAQVLQEQQLRSVTESCLMEVRGGWERTRRSLEESQGTMRTMAEALSRLRLHHKELRKNLEDRGKTKNNEDKYTSSSVSSTSMTTGNDTPYEPLNHPNYPSDPLIRDEKNYKKEDKNQVSELIVQHVNVTSSETAAVSSPEFSAVELLRKSEKGLKELHKALSSLAYNADRVLKSTQDLSTLEKGLDDM